MCILSIILFLLIGVWLGRNEIAYSFADIHILDILSAKLLGGILLFAMVIGVLWSLLTDNSRPAFEAGENYILLVSIVFTVSSLTLVRCHSSVITAFVGAWIAFCYMTGDTDWPVSVLSPALTLLVAPLLVLLVAYGFSRWFAALLFNRDCHLLLRNLYIKYVALVGLLICGILLIFNYTLFADPFFTSLIENERPPAVVIIAILVPACLGCLIPVVQESRRETRNGKTHHNLPFLYALSVVLLIGNALLPAISGMLPVLVSANQSKELCYLYFDSPKRFVHLWNVIAITILTPLLAFIVCLSLLMIDHLLLSSLILVFLLLLCLSYRMVTCQYSRNKQMRQALSVERLRKSEADEEMNRLDVVAVTSQFNSISAEIDLKQKELINLSLYIKQEREYLEGMCDRLMEISEMQNLEDIRESMRTQVQELRENMKFSREMDHFYADVEEMHKNFVSRLLMRCPNLTERERRLAILLRLGLSSKEIAGLVNIETKSIEINRYRLRKKLRLDRNENIVQFLQLL